MLTVQQAKKELKNGIASYLLKDAEGNYVLEEVNKLPFYLLGAPGIGKTQIVKQVAEELGIGFVSTSITHHSRNTVLGLPVITELTGEDGECVKYTRYTMSEILADVKERYEQGEKEGILLLDEFASMAESLVAPMLAFLQTKNIGNYVLPEGWTMVLCSNPPAYNRTAREFDAAIMDRVRVLNMEFSAKEFIAYGTEKNIHKTILEYLKLHKNHTYLCAGGKGDLVTTRGWENLSCCLTAYERMGQEVTQELIAQYIKSEEVAHSFYAFYITVGKNLPEELFNDILNGNNLQRHLTEAEKKTTAEKWGIMNQLVHGITEAAKEHEAEHSRYQSMIKVVETLKEKQEKLKDAWDFHELLRNRGHGKQSFHDSMEKEIFGNICPGEEEQERYRKVLRLLNEKAINDCVSKMAHLDEIPETVTNQTVLETMEEYVSVYKTELTAEMADTNDKITNVLAFLSRMDTDAESYVDAFVEKISQEQTVLNVLALCKNKAYGKAVCGVNAAWGRNLN